MARWFASRRWRPRANRAPNARQTSRTANLAPAARKFPDHRFTRVVSPNADTLYSAAWLDVSKEPIILSVPEMGKRYYLMQFLDGWSNTFACPGTRTTGNGKGDFAIVGPDWKGSVPTGMQEYRCPTNTAWLIGRTQTNGKDDYDAVQSAQQQVAEQQRAVDAASQAWQLSEQRYKAGTVLVGYRGEFQAQPTSGNKMPDDSFSPDLSFLN